MAGEKQKSFICCQVPYAVEELHHMPSCEYESSLPLDELGDSVCFSGINRRSHHVHCGGCIVVVRIYCPLCMCERVCVCVCMWTQLGRTVKHCPSTNGRGKPTGLTICLLHVRVCVGLVTFLFWMERYCLFRVCDLANDNLSKYTHTNSRFMQGLTQQTWHRKNLEDAGEEDNGTVILLLFLLETTQQKRKREKRKARRETWMKRLENGLGLGRQNCK